MKQQKAEESKFWTLYDLEHLDEDGVYRDNGIKFFRNVPHRQLLTDKKTFALIRQAQAGDAKARLKLRNAYLRFAAYGARLLIGWGLTPRTLLKHAELGLYYAIDHYTFETNVHFVGYCQECGYIYALEAVREHIRREKEWMEQPKARPTRRFARVEGLLRWQPMPPKVRAALNRLPDDWRLILCALYGLGAPKYSLRQVSQQRGLTTKQVARIKRSALNELSRCL